MKSLNDLIRRIIDLRAAGRAQLCLFAACPNSSAVS
jgi:hypothetical protein